MNTEQELLDGVKGLNAGRREHLEIDLKNRLKVARENFTNPEIVNVPVFWKDLAWLLKLAQMEEDGHFEEFGGLTFEQYQIGAKSTAIYPGNGTIIGLSYAALGLGETGEVQGKVKKVIRDDDGVLSIEKRDQIAKELGDVLWYLAAVADEIGVPLETIANANYKKLTSRKERGVLKGSGDER